MTLLLMQHFIPSSRHSLLQQRRTVSSPHDSGAKASEHRTFLIRASYGVGRSVRCCAINNSNDGVENLSDGSLIASRNPSLLVNVAQSRENGGGASSRKATETATMTPTPHAKNESLPPGQEQWIATAEGRIERAIFDFRFLTLMAVAGSLAGSLLCFLKGCGFVCESFMAYFSMCINGMHTGKVILRLVEAIDVYLVGTVMLIFGMGLYGLFISNESCVTPTDRALKNTSLFGMFVLKERPKWMCISSLDTLKTKLGHVIVMILLVKMFEKSKTVHISTSMDLLYYSVSIFLASFSLYVLQRLHV